MAFFPMRTGGGGGGVSSDFEVWMSYNNNVFAFGIKVTQLPPIYIRGDAASGRFFKGGNGSASFTITCIEACKMYVVDYGGTITEQTAAVGNTFTYGMPTMVLAVPL